MIRRYVKMMGGVKFQILRKNPQIHLIIIREWPLLQLVTKEYCSGNAINAFSTQDMNLQIRF